MKLSSSSTFENFLRESLCHISGNANPEKISYIFSKESCFFISGNGTTVRHLR